MVLIMLALNVIIFLVITDKQQGYEEVFDGYYGRQKTFSGRSRQAYRCEQVNSVALGAGWVAAECQSRQAGDRTRQCYQRLPSWKYTCLTLSSPHELTGNRTPG